MYVQPERRRLVRALTLAFCLCSTMTVATTVQPTEVFAQANTFLNNGYNYCDARILGLFWGMGPDQAKIEGGRKIQGGGGQVLRGEIMPMARNRFKCEWSDTGHTYQDAERLAAYWGYATPLDAKMKVVQVYSQGNTQQAIRALQAARRSGSNNSGGNSGGGQIGQAISVVQQQFSCNEGIPLVIDIYQQGNQRWAEATHDGVPSGRLRVRSNGQRLSNREVKLSLRNNNRQVSVEWGGIRDRCRRSN